MKKLLCLFAVLLLFSFKGKDSDCDNIAKIINSAEFDAFYQISEKRSDSETIYIYEYGDMDYSVLCNEFKTPTGKTINFAKVNFKVSFVPDPYKSTLYPNIIVWKESNEYHFFETDFNRKFVATVKRGKVKVVSKGVF